MVRGAFNAVHWYMEEVGARLVAKTGIPSDRHHMGKLILQGLKDDPDFVMQIDGATGESETHGSVLDRSIRCAISLSHLGLKKGDVMVLMGPNHLNFCIPHNAALFLGIMVASIDATLSVNELKDLFQGNRPNVVFGQSERATDIKKALTLAEVDSKIITFNEGSNYTTLAQLLEIPDKKAVEGFQPTDFDPSETVGYLTSTSGTTGLPKSAMLTHKNIAMGLPSTWIKFTKYPRPMKLALLTSPAQWLTAGVHFLFSAIMKYTRLQTSAPVTPEHFADMVNKYKPDFMLINPNMMTTMIINAKCDFSCFEHILLGGSAVTQDLINNVKELAQTDDVHILFGMSELCGMAVQHDIPGPPGSCGRPNGNMESKLVNPTTCEEITEPNVEGELWFRGPSVFKGYYKNPEATKEALTEDGWLRSGDIFYRDEYWNLFYVERYKFLLKYRNHQVSPVEIEGVIAKHPGVFHVAVTGIPDKECGDLVVACVVPKSGCSITAQEIKDLVKESLTDSKQLRGGVVFMKELPTTSTSKINRKKLKELVLTLGRE